ncbi:SOSS complex subunit C homolog isoform X2 [Drosophila obscura]|uniref:SOSS complex subunit C homolog isoform X2 n=1 Tax=Drosophila obscura TaxID=7282 RepID=UPI000BA12A70|nr:SOSS complex subunit C homolog isoform X2 [Drosophila obscura]
MAFPTTSAQQAETNRKILEDIQTKKQLLAGGIINLGLSNTNQLLGQPTVAPEFLPQGVGLPTNATPPRSAFNPTSSTTLGFFIPQDSYFGNSFIPVLPRLEPLPTTTPTTPASHIAPK